MLNLFDLDENSQVIVLPEAYFLKPFADIRDKYKDIYLATVELGYIYFMSDYRSDFDDIVDEDIKSEKILETMGDVSKKIKIDKKTQKAIEFYKERQPSISLRYLESMKKSLKSLQDALEEVNLTKTYYDEYQNSIEVYDTLALNRITDIIKKSPEIIKAIKEMEKQVKIELQENESHRGSGDKSIYEDG